MSDKAFEETVEKWDAAGIGEQRDAHRLTRPGHPLRRPVQPTGFRTFNPKRVHVEPYRPNMSRGAASRPAADQTAQG